MYIRLDLQRYKIKEKKQPFKPFLNAMFKRTKYFNFY
jgi:hypothetical protein